MKIINRNSYLDKLISVMGTPDIKVITGVRRSGKSKILELFMKHIKQNVANCNIIHINYNLKKFDSIAKEEELYKYVCSLYDDKKTNFLLIDEVQMCEGFERAINSIHAEEKFDIYITGSNAFLLSSDLATLFTGRVFPIKVYPFSFIEYVQYFKLKNIKYEFDDFVEIGGMSGSYLYANIEEKREYIKEIYNTLVIRDIKEKYNIKNVNIMENIIYYLMDNISNLTSINNITNVLNANGMKITQKTVDKYIDYLCKAFFLYKVNRYDIKGKKYLSTQNKYYLVDHSFRLSVLGTKNMDYGRLLENIVAMELLRRGYEIYVGVLYNKEIDFVAIKRNEKLYIQVSDNISNEKTFERECKPLLSINDAYPKMIIARTLHEEYDYNGIRIIDIAKWLYDWSH